MIPNQSCKLISLLSVVGVSLFLSQGSAYGQFQPTLELSALDGSNGFRIVGVNDGGGIGDGDGSGRLVSNAGDINNDGKDDLIIGTKAEGKSCYVVFGSDQGIANPFALSALNGSNGFAINRANNTEASARAISAAGDVNGDGVDDLIILAGFVSYVVFGSEAEFPSQFNLSSLDGSNGFVINVSTGISAVSEAGDINGDGIGDLVIGSKLAFPTALEDGTVYEGVSYVIFGSDQGLPNPLDLSTLNGSNGIEINSVNAFESLGVSVAGAGDFNGDGIDDLLIGSSPWSFHNKSAEGQSYVVFGSDQGIPSPFDLSTLNGSNGMAFNGAYESGLAGVDVSAAGDVNNDGIDDLLIGASGAGVSIRWPDNGSAYFERAGVTYVVFGSNQGLPAALNLADINGHNGFWNVGVEGNEGSGTSISGAGDVNGDGIDDFVIGSPNAGGGDFSGNSYVVFGSAANMGNPLRMINLDGSNGFTIKGAGAGGHSGEQLELYSGKSVSGAGDFNGDGIDDLIIGAIPFRTGFETEGVSFVIFGRGPEVFADGFEILTEE